ncbi:hypothetical protein E2P86_08625 [Sphingobacterium psychroaquaticum]|uniref:hypothetical protein n=1 Tax=Sphingobacterium psychroaquaticum TaxID=561061 RepID=UPI00106BCC3C|nr:hypothetical protein [Sphingobacterium psychroaquaticum]QBQ41217.1 hypothetical protein E2P86_08625 [Sphingobacterium psychroaquaticum]
MIYDIKRGNTVVWSGKPTGKQYKVIMQEDRVEIMINTVSALSLKKGDTITVFGQLYKLNRPENISKVNTQVGYRYNIEFEAQYYDLGKWTLYTLDRVNALTDPSVYLMGNAAAILGLLVQNANRADSGWSLGVVDETDVIQWTFSGAKLLTVLQDVADQTNLEFWVDGKVINLTRRQPETGVTLEYGKGKGLYELHRTRRDNPIVTHLTVLGGVQNIPNDYGFRNIQPTGGNPRVNPGYVAGMDRVESVVEFGNVYPRLEAKVTAVPGINVIRSTDIDFDLSNNLLNSGASAQIAFTSGQLAGFVFTINASGYDHATRQVTFNKIENDTAYPGGVPSSVLKPAIGDSFVFLNISMPASYVTTAEARVKELADQYFAEEGIEQYDWTGKLTPKFLLENDLEVVLGGLITLRASDIGFNGKIRIASFQRDIQQEYLYDFTLSNLITISSIVRQANYSDRLSGFFNASTSGGQGSASQDLFDVTKRGNVTPLPATFRGTHNTHLLGIPTTPPPAGEMKSDMAYISYSQTAAGGVDPEPGMDFYIKQAQDADLSNIQNGQLVYWDSTVGKFRGRNEQSLAAYATMSWVLTQGYITQGAADSRYLSINHPASGVTTSLINNWNAAYADRHTHANKSVLDGITSGLVDNWNAAYVHSGVSGNPHNTQFSQLLAKPTTLGGYGITDAVDLFSAQIISGRKTFTGGSSNAWNQTALEIQGNGTTSKYPGIAFHQPGIEARVLNMRHDAHMYLDDWRIYDTRDFTVGVNATPYTVVQRDGSGYIHAQYISLQLTKAGFNPAPINGLLGFNNVNGDEYAYQFSQSAVNQFLGMPAGGDTLQSVTNRGSFTTSFVKFGGLSNIVNGDGIEFFFDTSSNTGVIQAYGRGTSNAYQQLVIGASVLTLSSPLISASGKITCPVIEPSAFILPTAPPSNPETGKWYLYITTN